MRVCAYAHGYPPYTIFSFTYVPGAEHPKKNYG